MVSMNRMDTARRAQVVQLHVDAEGLKRSWPATNRERGQLIDKNIAGTITAEERARLDVLQAYADYHLQKVSPRPTGLLDELERRRATGGGTLDGRLRISRGTPP